jgi:hypothetical protein
VNIFTKKPVEKIQVSLKSDKNNVRALYMANNTPFFIISRSVLFRMRNVSDRNCTDNQNTHFVFNNCFFFRKSCRL